MDILLLDALAPEVVTWLEIRHRVSVRQEDRGHPGVARFSAKAEGHRALDRRYGQYQPGFLQDAGHQGRLLPSDAELQASFP